MDYAINIIIEDFVLNFTKDADIIHDTDHVLHVMTDKDVTVESRFPYLNIVQDYPLINDFETLYDKNIEIVYYRLLDDILPGHVHFVLDITSKYALIFSQDKYNITNWCQLYRNNFAFQNKHTIIESGDLIISCYVFVKLPSRKHNIPGHLILSLTSYPKRYHILYNTLRKLLHQSVTPDLFILNLDEHEYDVLPDNIKRFPGLTINLFKYDIKQYNKLIPTLIKYPDSYIVTFDDDKRYPYDALEKLTSSFVPGCIISGRAHGAKIKHTADGVRTDSKNVEFLPYKLWSHDKDSILFPTGCGGVLYSPNSLDPRVTDMDKFMKLCPTGDDIWFFFMGRLKGTKVIMTKDYNDYHDWDCTINGTLSIINNIYGMNDVQIKNMVKECGFR